MRLKEALKAGLRLLTLDEKSLAILRWKLCRGDATLRVEYDLTADSVVFDVGGYRGDWAAEILSRYDCRIHVFEPVPQYFSLIRARVGDNPKVTLNQAGLAGKAGRCFISVDEEGSSVEKHGLDQAEIELLDVWDYVNNRGIDRIDLMKINIEGGEYGLLDRMHEMDLIVRCTDMQIQFHDFVPDADYHRRRLREVLGTTHRLTYDYPFIWENWRLRENSSAGGNRIGRS